MPEPSLGRRHTLPVTARHRSGLLLDGGAFGEVLLPKRYVPAGLEPGGEIEVFLSLDSEDRPVATTETPLAMAGEFALLKVAATSRIGAFLDWGMPKDLFLPFGAQARRVKAGDEELVYVHVDPVSGRLLASAKLDRFVAGEAPPGVRGGNRVSLLIADQTDIGLRAIVDDRYWGMLPAALAGAAPARGGRCEGYVHRVRDDGLVDLGLEPPGYGKVPAAAERLAGQLAAAEGGFLPLHDKSPPEQVREVLGVSKKVFKQAAGALYKAGRIRIGDDGIYLV